MLATDYAALRISPKIGATSEVIWDGTRIDASEIGHIRDLGTTYAPERMAALYFYWDSKRGATVVTSGPRKLPTPADGT